jgi:hypothetical protein
MRASMRMTALCLFAMVLGCFPSPTRNRVVAPVTFNQYQAPGFNWSSVRRVLILPLCNESNDPRVSDDIRDVLGVELQIRSSFEVVLAPIDKPPEWSNRVRFSGQFDEAELVELAQQYRADAVLCGAVSHYHAYPPPRVGLSLRLISTAEGIVIASIDGQWDARNGSVAEEACAFYGRSDSESLSNAGPDGILLSPRLFQKYVCANVSYVLAGPGAVPVAAVPVQPVAVQPHDPPIVLPPHHSK